MPVCNPVRSPFGINRKGATPTPTDGEKAHATGAVSVSLRVYADDVGIGAGTVAVVCP